MRYFLIALALISSTARAATASMDTLTQVLSQRLTTAMATSHLSPTKVIPAVNHLALDTGYRAGAYHDLLTSVAQSLTNSYPTDRTYDIGHFSKNLTASTGDRTQFSLCLRDFPAACQWVYELAPDLNDYQLSQVLLAILQGQDSGFEIFYVEDRTDPDGVVWRRFDFGDWVTFWVAHIGDHLVVKRTNAAVTPGEMLQTLTETQVTTCDSEIQETGVRKR